MGKKISLMKKILEELIELIADIYKKIQPEHIVVTSDIAWWGKKKDFDEAWEWFQRLYHIEKAK